MFCANEFANVVYLRNIFLMDQNTEDFYKRLKSELETSTSWPSQYLYKFIVPSTGNNVDRVQNAFNAMGAIIHTNKSKTGKFTSLSIEVTMEDPQSVINKYLEVSDIEGIVSL